MGKYKYYWLSLLIIIWIGGACWIQDYFGVQPENKLYIQDREEHPLNYTTGIICEDSDSAIITVGDEIVCEYVIVADKIISLLPSIKAHSYGEETEDLVISGFEDYSNMNLQKAYELKNNSYNLKFKIYPKFEGKYNINITSEIYNPPVFHEFKESNNISLTVAFEDFENTSLDWSLKYLSNSHVNAYNNETETDLLKITLRCDDYTGWFTEDLASCYAILKNKGENKLHVLTNFYIIKNGIDVTNMDTILKQDNGMFNTRNKLSIYTSIKGKEEITRYGWFYPKEKGDYKIHLQTDIFNTNLLDSKKELSTLKLSFNVISREEYFKKEENRKTILITLIIALFLSTPIALRAIKELIS
ncbi:MAG: hypothetical protein KAQ92_00110 [Candidatus Aenigmarchaeota archaeon]|nr:hypothetical protein [Candidatus Aenigmarchaeota archaeon]